MLDLRNRVVDNGGNMNDEIKEAVNLIAETVSAIYDNPDLIRVVAKTQRKMMDALTSEGFSRKEALSIINSNSLLNSKK